MQLKGPILPDAQHPLLLFTELAAEKMYALNLLTCF